jgi:hypothetical protein
MKSQREEHIRILQRAKAGKLSVDDLVDGPDSVRVWLNDGSGILRFGDKTMNADDPRAKRMDRLTLNLGGYIPDASYQSIAIHNRMVEADTEVESHWENQEDRNTTPNNGWTDNSIW